MTAAEIRASFLDFFQEKGHTLVPSSSLMPSSPNLMFTNAGMNQFVPYFLGTEPVPYSPHAPPTPRSASAPAVSTTTSTTSASTPTTTPSSRCSATGASGTTSRKRPSPGPGSSWSTAGDSRPSGSTPRSTSPDPDDPAEFDQEAYKLWAAIFEQAGLDPATHVITSGKADNFWMMGNTGPCGPCSELHIDLTPEGDTEGALVNADDPRCIELWNLVFIQYNAEPDGSLRALPATHVDTGMGFERICSVLQGTRGFTDFSEQVSNYDTDVFAPLFRKLEELSGKNLSQDHARLTRWHVRTRAGRRRFPRHRRPHPHHLAGHCRRHPARKQRPELCHPAHPQACRPLRTQSRIYQRRHLPG